jgi:RNA polymerase sigma factor (sigma-70 family)
MLRLRTMEATAPTTIPLSSPRLQASRAADMAALDIFRPWRPDQPDTTYEKRESSQRMMAAIHTLPRRERKLIGLYYYRGHSLKEISVVLGIHESRASQLHLRAIKRLRTALSRSGVTRTAEN